MFELETQRGPYIDTYFRQHPNIAVSWIRDIGKSDYGSAARALLEDSATAKELETKHVNHQHIVLSGHTDVLRVIAHAQYRKAGLSGPEPRVEHVD